MAWFYLWVQRGEGSERSNQRVVSYCLFTMYVNWVENINFTAFSNRPPYISLNCHHGDVACVVVRLVHVTTRRPSMLAPTHQWLPKHTAPSSTVSPLLDFQERYAVLVSATGSLLQLWTAERRDSGEQVSTVQWRHTADWSRIKCRAIPRDHITRWIRVIAIATVTKEYISTVSHFDSRYIT